MTSAHDHLDSPCARDICRNPSCEHVAKLNPANGRWYITMGHAGFNSTANNGSGYKTCRAAAASSARFLAR